MVMQGPIGLLTTTTKVGIHPENATRVIFVPVDDSKQQTEAIFQRLADETEYPIDLSRWIALQSWLEGGEKRVTIPFGSIIAENTIPSDVRLRRDFTTFMTLHQNSCLRSPEKPAAYRRRKNHRYNR